MLKLFPEMIRSIILALKAIKFSEKIGIFKFRKWLCLRRFLLPFFIIILLIFIIILLSVFGIFSLLSVFFFVSFHRSFSFSSRTFLSGFWDSDFGVPD